MKSFRNLPECVALKGAVSNLPTGTQAAGTTLPGQEELLPSIEQILHDNESSRLYCDTFRDSSLFLDLPEDVALKCLAHVSRSDFPSVSKVCKAWWTLLQTKDFYLTRKGAGILEEWLYCYIQFQDVTGEWLTRWEVLNPKHNGDWKALRHMPGVVRVGSCTVVVNDTLFVIGGRGRPWMREDRSATSDVYIYDPVLDKWTRGASMKEVRYEFGCGVLDGKVYVCGGLGNHSKVLCSVEVYDPEKDEWISAPPLRMPRLGCFAAGVGGKLYVVGGQGSLRLDSSPDPFMDVLDPETGQWQDLKNGCGLVLAHAVVNGKIFFVEWKDSRTLRCYDTADNSWSRITMPFAADRISCNGVCLGTYEGKLQFFPKLLLPSANRPSDTIVYDPEAAKGSEWQKSPMISRGGCLRCESMAA